MPFAPMMVMQKLLRQVLAKQSKWFKTKMSEESMNLFVEHEEQKEYDQYLIEQAEQYQVTVSYLILEFLI